MHKISIITPVFNSFSLMTQNLKVLEKWPDGVIELIVVDDCSTDGSYERAVEYAQNSRVNMVILKNEKNAGPGVSRNRGIEVATGDYITFVDSDDYLRPDFIEHMKPLMDQSVDCVIFDYQSVSDIGVTLKSGTSIGMKKVQEGFLDNKTAFVYTHGSTGGKMYKKDVIDRYHIRFGDLFRNEDMPFTKNAIARSRCVYYLKQELYYYVQIGTSLMHNTSLSDERNCQKAFRMLSDNLADIDLKEELLSIEMREVLNNSVLIKLSNGDSGRKIRSYIKDNYRLEHLHNRYFYAYPFYVKLISWAIYTRCIWIIRILLFARKQVKVKHILERIN